MRTDDHQPITGLVQKLERLAELSDECRASIIQLPHRLQAVESGALLVREGDRVKECCLLVDGYACRQKITPGGGRQIVSFHIPGDVVDLQHLFLSIADHNVQTITRATVAWIQLDSLRAIALERPQIAEALWRDVLIDAAIFRDWVVNVGRRNAKMRIAHILCEFAARQEATGLGEPARFGVPMTQEQIGDATGLTSVHVNRMLRALEEDGVLSREGKQFTISDWESMCKVADFDPTYLHGLGNGSKVGGSRNSRRSDTAPS